MNPHGGREHEKHAMKPLVCPACGAPLEPGAERCAYCGTPIVYEKRTAANWRQVSPRPTTLPQPDFGIAARWWGRGGLLIGLGVYLVGWLFEDTRYMLADTAVAIWIGAVPLVLLLAAALWRASRPVWWYGVILAAVIFAFHLGVMRALIHHRLWDDHYGIAGMVAGAAGGGWLLGRVVHLIIRRWRHGTLP